MFFHESDAIVREHPDLFRVASRIDQHLSGICSPSPLRPGDFACQLGADGNQVASTFELLRQKGALRKEEMVECEDCRNLMSAEAFQQAIEDEDPLECTACGRVFPRRTKSLAVYRMTSESLNRTKAAAKQVGPQISELLGTQNSEEPLSERAQHVLLAMLELDAADSDRRQSTEVIAGRALGGKDANSLKTVMAELKTRKLIDSKTGRGGGCWLTDSGRHRAQKLRDSNRNSATV